MNPSKDRLLACLAALRREAAECAEVPKDFYANAVSANWHGYHEGITFAIDEIIAALPDSWRQEFEEMKEMRT